MTDARPTRQHLLARLVTALGLVLAALTVLAAPAQADPSCTPVQAPDGSIHYQCTTPGTPAEPGDPGSGGNAGPSCDLVAPATFCSGDQACWYLDHNTPYAPPAGPPPKPGADWKVRSCRSPDGGITTAAVWMDGTQPQPPTLQQQAQTAFGQLDPALGSLGVNPRRTSLVSLPTWFWADGVEGRLTGSSAFGLVAIARPDHLDLDPGDGGGAWTCPWSTSESDTCSYTYVRSSALRGGTEVDGHRAYAASAQPVWTVSYEMNGTPVAIPGARTELRGPRMTSGVRVAEVQATVNGTT